LPGWTEDLIDNKGFGVYCTVRGAHTFDWTFPEDKEHKEIFFKADKRNDNLTDRQKNYQVTASMDAQLKDIVVWVPTTKAFEMGTLHMPSIIGHNAENPTHKIDVDPITLKTLVVPVTDENGNPRITDVDEEFSIDYNLLGSKDDSHLGKQRKKTRKKRKRVAKRKPPASRKPPAKKRNKRVAKRKPPASRKPPAKKRNKRTNAKHKKDDVIDLTGDIDKATAKPTRVTAKRKNRNAPAKRTNTTRKTGDDDAGAATSVEITGDIGKATAKPTRVTAKRKNRDKATAKPTRVTAKRKNRDKATAKPTRVTAKRKNRSAPAKRTNTTRKTGDDDAGATTSATANAEAKDPCREKSARKRRRKRNSKRDWLREVKDMVYTDPQGGGMYEAHESTEGCAGQCLFTAFQDQLDRCSNRESMSYQELRELAVTQQLRLANSDEYEKGVHRSIRDCIRMRSGRRYGDNAEIVALSKALSVNVRVMLHIQGGTKMWIPVGEDKPDSPTFRLVLDYESPNSSLNHYMSLRRVRRERRHETVNDIKIIELDGIVHKL